MNTEAAILQAFEKMPENLKQELLHYAEYLVQNHSQSNTAPVDNSNLKKRPLAGSMKGTFVLPLPDDFDESLENFQEQLGESHGYGSWAGKIIMSDDFDEPLEDLEEYM